MTIETSAEVRGSLTRLKSTFGGDYDPIPLYDGKRKVGRIQVEGQRIYLTFRGSIDSVCEVLSCLDLRKTPLKELGLVGKAHAGIYRSFRRVQKTIDAFLSHHFSKIDPKNGDFTIEGYSRGSGLAVLTAAYIAQKFSPHSLKVLTFSSMNVFDKDAALAYGRKVQCASSFVCTRDFFPRWFGPSFLGFYPTGDKLAFSAEDSPSFADRVKRRAFTHLTQHWLVSRIVHCILPIGLWEAHMPETYEDGALVALKRRQI